MATVTRNSSGGFTTSKGGTSYSSDRFGNRTSSNTAVDGAVGSIIGTIGRVGSGLTGGVTGSSGGTDTTPSRGTTTGGRTGSSSSGTSGAVSQIVGTVSRTGSRLTDSATRGTNLSTKEASRITQKQGSRTNQRISRSSIGSREKSRYGIINNRLNLTPTRINIDQRIPLTEKQRIELERITDKTALREGITNTLINSYNQLDNAWQATLQEARDNKLHPSHIAVTSLDILGQTLSRENIAEKSEELKLKEVGITREEMKRIASKTESEIGKYLSEKYGANTAGYKINLRFWRKTQENPNYIEENYPLEKMQQDAKDLSKFEGLVVETGARLSPAGKLMILSDITDKDATLYTSVRDAIAGKYLGGTKYAIASGIESLNEEDAFDSSLKAWEDYATDLRGQEGITHYVGEAVEGLREIAEMGIENPKEALLFMKGLGKFNKAFKGASTLSFGAVNTYDVYNSVNNGVSLDDAIVRALVLDTILFGGGKLGKISSTAKNISGKFTDLFKGKKAKLIKNEMIRLYLPDYTNIKYKSTKRVPEDYINFIDKRLDILNSIERNPDVGTKNYLNKFETNLDNAQRLALEKYMDTPDGKKLTDALSKDTEIKYLIEKAKADYLKELNIKETEVVRGRGDLIIRKKVKANDLISKIIDKYTLTGKEKALKRLRKMARVEWFKEKPDFDKIENLNKAIREVKLKGGDLTKASDKGIIDQETAFKNWQKQVEISERLAKKQASFQGEIEMRKELNRIPEIETKIREYDGRNKRNKNITNLERIRNKMEAQRVRDIERNALDLQRQELSDTRAYKDQLNKQRELSRKAVIEKDIELTKQEIKGLTPKEIALKNLDRMIDAETFKENPNYDLISRLYNAKAQVRKYGTDVIKELNKTYKSREEAFKDWEETLRIEAEQAKLKETNRIPEMEVKDSLEKKEFKGLTERKGTDTYKEIQKKLETQRDVDLLRGKEYSAKEEAKLKDYLTKEYQRKYRKVRKQVKEIEKDASKIERDIQERGLDSEQLDEIRKIRFRNQWKDSYKPKTGEIVTKDGTILKTETPLKEVEKPKIEQPRVGVDKRKIGRGNLKDYIKFLEDKYGTQETEGYYTPEYYGNPAKPRGGIKLSEVPQIEKLQLIERLDNLLNIKQFPILKGKEKQIINIMEKLVEKEKEDINIKEIEDTKIKEKEEILERVIEEIKEIIEPKEDIREIIIPKIRILEDTKEEEKEETRLPLITLQDVKDTPKKDSVRIPLFVDDREGYKPILRNTDTGKEVKLKEFYKTKKQAENRVMQILDEYKEVEGRVKREISNEKYSNIKTRGASVRKFLKLGKRFHEKKRYWKDKKDEENKSMLMQFMRMRNQK